MQVVMMMIIMSEQLNIISVCDNKGMTNADDDKTQRVQTNVTVTKHPLPAGATSRRGQEETKRMRGWQRGLANGWHRQAGVGSGGGRTTRKRTNNKVQDGYEDGDNRG